jgi:hypothetical protein
MADTLYYKDFVVPISGTTGSVDLGDYDVYGLMVPTLDSTTLTLKVSHDNVTFVGLKDGGGTATMFHSAGTGAFAFDTRDMAGVAGYRYLQVVCGSAQNSAARTFTLCRKAPRRK